MRQLPRAVAAALGAATALVLGLPASAASAQPVSPDEQPEVDAVLGVLAPAAPVPGDTLVLAGSVTNGSGEAVDNVQALLRYSADPLESRSDVQRSEADLAYRYGRRDERYFQVVAERLEAGATATFRLEVPVDELPFQGAGVYSVGVDVRGTPPSGLRSTLDTERTLLPWMDGVQAPPVPVSMLWTLAAPPSLLPDGTLRSDTLAEDLTPTGRLSGLLDAAGDAPVGWLVDPDLLETVDVMADGYEVSGPDGEPVPGSGQQAAADWREAFDATVGGAAAVLPYASPDVAALTASDPAWAAEVTDRAVAAAQRAAADGAGGRADLAAPAGGAAGTDALGVLAAAGIRTVVLAADALATPRPTPDPDSPAPAVGPVTRVEAGDASLTALVTDPGLTAGLRTAAPFPAGAGEPAALQVRQRWLAETAMAVLDARSAGIPPAPLVVATPETWRPDPGLARTLVEVWTSTPWVSAVEAPLGEPPTGTEPLVAEPPEAAASAELPADFLAGAVAAQRASTRYLHLLAEPEATAAVLEPAQLRTTSSAWRTELAAGREYVTTLTTEARARVEGVSVLVPESVTLSSRAGVFPLTVANDLDQAVLVDLDLRPANPDRLSIEAVESLRVEAGEKAAVDVRAQAAANGSVPVSVRLTTTDDEPLGGVQRLVVVATDYGTIGWVVMALGGGILATAAVVRLRRARGAPPVRADR